MRLLHRLQLQLFAGEGGDSGTQAPTGESAAAAGQQRLREPGVPESRLRAQGAAWDGDGETPAHPAQHQGQAAAAETEETGERMSWEQIMKDPEYNAQMRAVVQQRLREAKSAQQKLQTLAPALDALAKKYDLAPEDYASLATIIQADYARSRADGHTQAEQKIQQHFRSLEQQGEALKKMFPGFDLRQELKNDVFARLTAPGTGVSVEDAYYATHRTQIQTAAMQAAARKTAEKLSNAIQSGSRRPQENGTTGQAPSVPTFDYRRATPAQRQALKNKIQQAAARGEKLYPSY